MNKSIKQLNDAFRAGHVLHGTVLMTQGIQALGQEKLADIAQMVQDFHQFSSDNNPRDEHDFGSFEFDGHSIFFKIDYYNLDMQYHSPDPADPNVTHSVLTIMLAEEY